MKRLVLGVGLLITAAGVVVGAVPSAVIRFTQHGVTAFELYASAVARVGIGVLFIVVAPTSRLPRLLRVFGMIAVMAGLVTPLLGVARAQTIADWVSHQGLGLVRAFGLLALAIGAAIVYACGPRRGAAYPAPGAGGRGQPR